MENPIKTELKELAKSILDEYDTLDLMKIRMKAQELYEKIIIANHFQETKKETNTPEIETSLAEDINLTEEKNLQEDTSSEPKDKEYLDDLLQEVSSEIVFEEKKEKEIKKSLNDNFSKTIKIGLNDRIAFIKYLFNDNETDFLNTVKRIDETSSEKEVLEFIKNEIKPKYNNWDGKEIYQTRFMDWITNRFK